MCKASIDPSLKWVNASSNVDRISLENPPKCQL